MGRNKSISPTKRAKIVSLFKDAKMDKSKIARLENVSRRAVNNALTKFENGNGASMSFRDAPRSGRSCKLDDRSVRRLVRLVEEDRRKPARILREEISSGGGPSVHVSTIKRRLKEEGLVARVAVKKPFISQINMQKRLKFAKDRISWTPKD